MAQITSGRVKLAEHARNAWVAIAPHGETLESALAPEWWAGVATRFRKYDRVDLIAEDDSWIAELLVIGANRLGIDVRVLNLVQFDETKLATGGDADAIPAGYDVNYGGPVHKYRVIRNSDAGVLAHGMSKKDAIAWARDHANGKAPAAKANGE